MHIERVPNRNSPPAVLLRQSYREEGKVRKRTLANLSKLPDDVIEGLRILLKGGSAAESLRFTGSFPKFVVMYQVRGLTPVARDF
jgi:hypothetical protein